MLAYVLKRLWSHRSLALCLWIGLAAAVALAVAVPLYSDGVNYNLLNQALAAGSSASFSAAEPEASSSGRAPFTFIFHYVGSWHEPIAIKTYQPVDDFMRQSLAKVIGLPGAAAPDGYVSTDNLQFYPDIAKINKNKRLDLVKLAVVYDLADHIQLVDGQFPATVTAADAGADGPPLEALASLKLANDLGLEVGKVYLVYKAASGEIPALRLRVKLTGFWTPRDLADPFWFYPAEALDKKLLIPEETFFKGPLAGSTSLPAPINETAWSFTFDGNAVYSEDVPGLLARISQAQTKINALLPNTDLETSPVQALRSYRRESTSLTGLMFVFSAPVLGLALYFLGLVAAMLVRRQRSEIAILRSRGASRLWIAGVYLLEWGLLGALALAGGLAVGERAALLVGQTQSFLDFSRPTVLPLRITPTVLASGAAAIGLALLFSVLPAWQSSRDTIISYKRERARSRRAPFWQRFYLDFLLLLPTLYGLYTLRMQGKLRLFGQTLGSTNPFENPLLFLLPAIFIVSLSLILLRFLPRILSALAWFFAQFSGVVPIMALRQLSRSTGDHLGPLALMIVTLSLAGFISSMAQTLDAYLADSAYYQAGADLNLAEGGEYTGERPTDPNQPTTPGRPSTNQPPESSNEGPAVWNFLPVTDHLALPGVQAAARVGRYPAELSAGGRVAGGRLMGIDRTEFPFVAFFRDDFAGEPLVAVANRLAFDPSAILVDRATWERFSLNAGDTVQLSFTPSAGASFEAAFKVAGLLDYFPTLYPEDGPFFIANLEYLFEAAGGMQPYDVWLRTTPTADAAAIVTGINSLGVAVLNVQDARAALAEAYAAPNRQGMLGLLSVGFLAASILTVIGFFLYSLFSFQERFIQLGVLRAVGLTGIQMAIALALEQIFLIFTGLSAGTAIAVLTATLFIPYLPVSMGSHPGVPPYLVQIAWGDITRVYLVFGAMLLVGLSATLVSLSRMKIFQAVKLGEIG